MNFGEPQYLWLLLGVPLLALLARRARHRRDGAWMILEQRGAAPGDRSTVVILALALLVAAMARPRIGRALEGPSGPGRDVVLAFDVSRSMGAEDAAPNRLGLAVETARSLVHVLAGEPADRAAIVAFAGRGVLRCPLTQNFGAALDAMDRLRPGDVRPGGTDLGAALDAAADAFDPEQSTEGGTIILFSDGEDHQERWERPLERLIRMGVVVHAVGLGDVEKGWPVPSASGAPLKHQGSPVASTRVDEALAAIAERSGGAYLKLGMATTDLGPLFRDRVAPVADTRRRAARSGDRPERFPLFLGAALGLLVIGFWPWRFSLDRAAGLALLGAVAGAQLGASTAQSTPDERESAAAAIDRGRLAYDRGRYAEALDAFERATALAPGRAVPRYDAAAALYQLGRFADAIEGYQSARETAGEALRVKIDYGLGNASIGLGDFAGAIHHYDACLASTASGAQLDAVRADAAVNRRFAVERLRNELAQADEPDELTNSSDEDQPKAPPRSSDAHKDDEPGEGPGDHPPDDANEAEDAASSSPQKSGGAGGSGRNPNPPADHPPGDRLDSALERIRDAKRRRLPDQPPPDDPQSDIKDW